MTLAQLGEILEARLEDGRATVLVTLLGREGHAYAEPGAHLLIDPNAPTSDEAVVAGYLSGGCLESEVAARTQGMNPAEATRRFTLDVREDGPFAIDLACGGTLDLLAEWVDLSRVSGDGWLAWATHLASRQEAVRWIGEDGTYAWRAGALHVDARRTPQNTHPDLLTREVETYPEILGPRSPRTRLRPARGGWIEVTPRPPRLWIIGTERDGEAVAAQMLQQGWQVEIAAPSRMRLEASRLRLKARAGIEPGLHVADAAGFAKLDIDLEDRVLAASHRLDLDAAGLQKAYEAHARWMGAIGSQRRADILLQDFVLDTDELHPHRIEMPVGLSIGARGPEEVATSIAARLIEDLHDATRPVWAIIPAAGEGRRLGASKPLLHDGNETLLARAQRRVEPIVDGTIVVTGCRGEEVAEVIEPSATRVHHAAWQEGMASSLLAGLAHLPRNARAMIVLPDMPHVDEGHLAELRRAAGQGAWRGAVSRQPEGGVGVPALLPDDVIANRHAAPQGPHGDAGFMRFLKDRGDLKVVHLKDGADLDTRQAAEEAGWFTVENPERTRIPSKA